ncbi:hypothetical protein [Paraburkholderia sp. SG-MS1]|uniref:hypothetical protein n=1 Tax=Paraburkholderia sp. SG-MS1 TaxID=2023741 RepID=UPI001EEB669F|nr:hypothetical protein [Paraburkholderia sp. SG-MS1]
MKVYLHENILKKNSFSFSRVFTDRSMAWMAELMRPAALGQRVNCLPIIQPAVQ